MQRILCKATMNASLVILNSLPTMLQKVVPNRLLFVPEMSTTWQTWSEADGTKAC